MVLTYETSSSKLTIEPAQLQPIMRSYRLRRRYHQFPARSVRTSGADWKVPTP